MLKPALAFLLLALTCAAPAGAEGSASLEAPAEPPDLLGWTTADLVSVREEPEATSPARGRVHAGNRFELEDTGTVWVRVAAGRFKGGYVHIRNLKLAVTPAGRALVKEAPVHGEKSWTELARASGPYHSITEDDAAAWLRALNGGTETPSPGLKKALIRSAP